MLWQIPAFTLCAFNTVKYLESSFSVKFLLWSFAGITSSEAFFLFHLNYLLIYVKKFTLTNLTVAHVYRVSWMVPLSTFLHSAVCTVTLFTFDLNFTSISNTFIPSSFPSFSSFPLVSLLYFTLHIHLCWWILFLYQLSIFCKMLHKFTTRRQKGNSVPYLAVCVWTC